MACHPQTFVNLEVSTCKADFFWRALEGWRCVVLSGLMEFKSANLGYENLSASKSEVSNDEEIRTRCF